MKNKIAFITGSTDGIGRQIALELARMGATILLHGRNQEKAKVVLKEIKDTTKTK
ncbi:MAG: SDR family NAD(P)-dependent oxidoreductase [Thermodesulfobacteriota bacterium]|nr:SDR family NAD(P)-dependent oxidoreductase [Thermodesulfobacteriota bacterium]